MSVYNDISYSEIGNNLSYSKIGDNTIEHFSYNIKDFDRTTVYGEYCDNNDFYKTSFTDTSKKSPDQISIINETNNKLENAKKKFCSTITNDLIINKQKKDKIEILKNQILKFDGTLTALEIEKEKGLSYSNMANIYDNIYNKIDTVNRIKQMQLNTIPYRSDPDVDLQNAINDYYNVVNNNDNITFISEQSKKLDEFINMLQADLLKLIIDKYNETIKLYNIIMKNFNNLDYSLSYIPDEESYKIDSFSQLIISVTDDVELIINKESKIKDIRYISKDEIYSNEYQDSLLDLYKLEKKTFSNIEISQQNLDKVILENGYDNYSIWSILSLIMFLIILILIIIYVVMYYNNLL